MTTATVTTAATGILENRDDIQGYLRDALNRRRDENELLIASFTCPLCSGLKPFKTPAGLQQHLNCGAHDADREAIIDLPAAQANRLAFDVCPACQRAFFKAHICRLSPVRRRMSASALATAHGSFPLLASAVRRNSAPQVFPPPHHGGQQQPPRPASQLPADQMQPSQSHTPASQGQASLTSSQPGGAANRRDAARPFAPQPDFVQGATFKDMDAWAATMTTEIGTVKAGVVEADQQGHPLPHEPRAVLHGRYAASTPAASQRGFPSARRAPSPWRGPHRP